MNTRWTNLNLIIFKQIKALPCVLSSPCQNGAACKNDNLGGYTCTCVAGYTGTNCQYGIKSTCFFLKIIFD